MLSIDLAGLCAAPNPLADHYRAFAVDRPGRLLLTGHSHQAWPDVAREGMLEAFDDAAAGVDEKWARAFAKADAVRAGFAAWLGDPGAQIALGASTHDLVLRFLSALPLRRRPRVVTSDGEFHTLRRQLTRLAEAGLDVVRVPASPAGTLAERLAAAVDERTSAVLVSAVLFESSHVVPGLGELAAACERAGAELLVDVYHALGPVDWTIPAAGVERAWVVGGGYKYLQLGEGNCFLRLPAHAHELRPVVTGWYAEFASLDAEHDPDRVAYGHGAVRFAGSTYDPTSHYRAARVLRFFAAVGLTPEVLHANYRRQVDLLAERFDALGLPPTAIDRDRGLTADQRGGFLALRTPRAGELQHALAQRGVLSDSRGDALRFGPAPYLTDAQLDAAIAALGDAVAAL
ncbi:MAG: kynureninase [Actinobacteria bacterium]|nr:kynureninase [Actinomycetota bacterium]